ncbi:hypothetical protein K7G92_000663 [Pasteurella canis]|uniref:hypothetical protein n=1 Tax=Pasteurella TaxID=745 RepID=UPI000D9F43E7|nr:MULTISPECIES: hypothetical protein [Pasteurella]UEA17460.1 hypothetical protein K7G92_000663 [Pasteurella canis]UEC23834.1 hypothetical protein K7G93_000595 [Pasteurella canis]WRK09997.1 hypothetical protein RFF20_03250 [Pasteurella multocida]SPY33220.1 Mu-like prophage protein gpG [Pasteurella canis]HDR0997899.1 hypothetical protein [Pasteurella multocida]
MSVSISGNFNALKDLAKTLNELVKKDVFVGIPEEVNKSLEDQPSFNMASLAAVLEFGNDHIPERPFLRQTLNDNREKYVSMFVNLFKKGVEPEKIYEQLALIAQADVQENIVRGNWVPNNPKTIKRKGSSKPLIDTGKLRQSIKGVVR